MDILFECGHCGKHCCVGADAVGKTFPCPDCGEPVITPETVLVFPCSACGTVYSSPESLGGTAFLCPACEEKISIPKTSVLVCPACGINMEIETDFYDELDGRKLECPECGKALRVPARPRVKKAHSGPHPPGFGNKTLRLDTILESIPQADQLRDGNCPFCGHAVEQYSTKSYTCSHCARQITMTTPTVKRGERLEE